MEHPLAITTMQQKADLRYTKRKWRRWKGQRIAEKKGKSIAASAIKTQESFHYCDHLETMIDDVLVYVNATSLCVWTDHSD